MSLVQTPADDPKMAAEEDHEVAAATKSGRPTAKDEIGRASCRERV